MRRLSLVRRLTRNGTSRGDERPTVSGDPEEWPVGGNPENIQAAKPTVSVTHRQVGRGCTAAPKNALWVGNGRWSVVKHHEAQPKDLDVWDDGELGPCPIHTVGVTHNQKWSQFKSKMCHICFAQ